MSNLEHAISVCNSTLYCTHEDKKNMWIYVDNTSQSLFLIDPITPHTEVICLVDSLDIQHKYIVLTACQRKKKKNVLHWRKIYPDFKVISPDYTYLQDELIIPVHSFKSLENIPNIIFLSVLINDSHRLCIKTQQYLFVGELVYNIYINKEELFKSRIAASFFSSLDPNIILLHSFGPITLFKDMSFLNKSLQMVHEFSSDWDI